MPKIGFGSNRKITAPEGYVEGSISWENLARTAVDSQADIWFEEFSPAAIKGTLPKGAVDADPPVADIWQSLAPALADENAPMAIPGLELDPADLGEQIDLTEGVLGPALIESLNAAGVNWRYETSIPVSHEESIELPAIKLIGTSQWGTYFGMPIEQTFRVFKNSDGTETCVWSANLLAATRPFEHLAKRELSDPDTGEGLLIEISEDSIKKGAFTFGQWSSRIFIPVLAKKLFYLAETPFPSNVLMSFGRKIAFGEAMSPASYPRPVLINKPQSFARGAYEQNENGFLSSGTIMPHVVEMGWTFTTTDQSEITTILQVVTEGICKIATILEDGYLNYRIDDYPYPYDYVTLEAALFDRDYVQGDSALGLSRWVPVCRLGFLLNESNQRADAGVNRGEIAEQFWVASDGAGMYVPNAINSLVFSTLIEAEDWYTIDRLLDASVRMDVKNESTNSLSNWGIAKYKQGLISEAIEKFEAALQREDKFAEAEASYWLTLIYEQNDDTKTAGIYRSRCEAAGGYSGPQGVEILEVGLTKSNKQGLGEPVLSKQAAFCGQCGTQFKDDSAKFCANCGSAR